VWSDLQLPLYRRALQTGCIQAKPSGGLSEEGAKRTEVLCDISISQRRQVRVASGIGKITPEKSDDAAWRCAQGVAAAIRRGEFWPPNEAIRPDYDDFASLFHHGAADSVEWEAGTDGASDSGLVAEERAT